MLEFLRFPHTPHLAWLGPGQPRSDKLLDPPEVETLLADKVVVEEKVDGANLGFSTTEDGELQAQNRGGYLLRESVHPQFRPLWAWLASRQHDLVDALWPDLMLFGEWCFVVHSVQYDRLPDWFLGFDIYDRAAGRFWDTARRDDLLSSLGLHAVPRIAQGHFDLALMTGLLGTSRLGAGPMEGIVVRREVDGWTTARAKLVRAEFTQAIDAHWSQGRLVLNTLNPSPSAAAPL